MKVAGTVHVPGDKSISHRALIFSALGTGSSRVRGILQSADVHSTAGVLRALGVSVPQLGADIRIAGVGLRGFRRPDVEVDCGNSGTTARLMAGAVAASSFTTAFIGDESLSRRPMRRIASPLEAMGARVEFATGRPTLPMSVTGGKLRSIEWTSETASAQTKSAILLAGLVGGVPVEVIEPGPSRDHTERMLSALGGRVSSTPSGESRRITFEPPEAITAMDLVVPGDPSSAAFFAALAALASSGEILQPAVLMNETRAGFLSALREMGASIDQQPTNDQGSGERVGTIRVSPGRLRGITIGPAEIPSMIDELPLLACVAARAEGETIITGAAELRVKESDRIATVVGNLRALGVEAEELPDGMRIVGDTKHLQGSVRTHGDHRIAMAFGILGALDGSRIVVDDPDCVAVSYPAFWTDLQRVTA